MNVVRRLFQKLQQRVGGLFHEVASRQNEDLAWPLCWQILRTLDHFSDLSQLDEQLRGIRRDDENIRMLLDQHTSLLLIRLPQPLASLNSRIDQALQVNGCADASAVPAYAAVARKRLSGGPHLSWLPLALHGHGEHEREGVLACAFGTGKYQ